MMIAGDNLILHNDYGSLIIAQLNEDSPKFLAKTRPFRKLGQNWTVPVLAGGRLYCRGGREGHLACFDVSE